MFFKPFYNRKFIIKVFNVPTEYTGGAIEQLIAHAGGVVTRCNIVTQTYHGFTFSTGERHYVLDTAAGNFIELPPVLRLFGGRLMEVRYSGQDLTDQQGCRNRYPAP